MNGQELKNYTFVSFVASPALNSTFLKTTLIIEIIRYVAFVKDSFKTPIKIDFFLSSFLKRHWYFKNSFRIAELFCWVLHLLYEEKNLGEKAENCGKFFSEMHLLYERKNYEKGNCRKWKTGIGCTVNKNTFLWGSGVIWMWMA